MNRTVTTSVLGLYLNLHGGAGTLRLNLRHPRMTVRTDRDGGWPTRDGLTPWGVASRKVLVSAELDPADPDAQLNRVSELLQMAEAPGRFSLTADTASADGSRFLAETGPVLVTHGPRKGISMDGLDQWSEPEPLRWALDDEGVPVDIPVPEPRLIVLEGDVLPSVGGWFLRRSPFTPADPWS